VSVNSDGADSCDAVGDLHRAAPRAATRITGMVKRDADGGQDAFLTLSSHDPRCPSPLEFPGVIYHSVFAVIEVDSRLVTARAAWAQ
jgi:hypothetical protein